MYLSVELDENDGSRAGACTAVLLTADLRAKIACVGMALMLLYVRGR